MQFGNPCRRDFFYRLGWSTRIKPAPLEFLAGRDHAFGGDHCAGTDFGVVHNHRVLAENTVVADRASVNKAESPHSYVCADPCAENAVGNVHGTRFSEPAVGTDKDIFPVGTHRCQFAETAARADFCAADYRYPIIGCDVRSNLRDVVEIRKNNHRYAFFFQFRAVVGSEQLLVQNTGVSR